MQALPRLLMNPLAIGIVDTRTVVIASILAAIGILLIIAGWFGLIDTSKFSRSSLESASERAIRTVCAVVSVMAVFSLTGWIVATAFAGVGGWFALTFKNAKRERRKAIARVDAIATWVENIRDNINGSAGLQQALRMSGNHAPKPIRSEVRDLVLNLQHEPVVLSLRRFAADLAHPTSDMAVGCLILASSRSAGSLTTVLANTAQAARDSASMLRQVEAGRAASQSQAKLVTIITSVMSVFMITGQREFVAPYNTFIGQIVLFVICGMFAISAVLVYRLSKTAPQPRVFRGVEVTPPPSDNESVAAGAEIRS